jgi:uncharacterized protein (TIGR03086 family)
MATDLLDLYRRASDWTDEKIAGATRLDAPTPCDEWDVRTLLNHMLETQRYFLHAGRGQEATPPGPTPPALISDDPVRDFTQVQDEIVSVFSEAGVLEKTGPMLGIAFADSLLHGWDLARSSGQGTEMPAGLAEAAYEMIHGRFDDEQRKGMFKPEVAVPKDASPQDRLLAYTGRNPR